MDSEVVLQREKHRSIAYTLAVLHVVALGLAPFFFSWLGLAVGAVLLIVIGAGVTVGYHRLLTHSSFETKPWVRQALTILGVLSGEGHPIFWVAIHRRHHQHADTEGDPHSPTVDSLYFAHMAWLWSYNRAAVAQLFSRYARDLCKEPFMRRMARQYLWWHAGLALLLIVAGWLYGGWFYAGSFFVYGMLLRTVVGLHITWMVNSFTHRYGYRNYETRDDSRNHWLVALFTLGEGWHNNHHHEPRLAHHGWHRWWEFDLWYIVIWLLAKLGLAWNVQRHGTTE